MSLCVGSRFRAAAVFSTLEEEDEVIEEVRIRGYRIYREFSFHPNDQFNVVVGANESGKSTLLEAISLALTGRVNGRSASEELNPHWFNAELVAEFVTGRRDGEDAAFPTIEIEVFLRDRDDLQNLAGANNSRVPTSACPGVVLRVEPNPEYHDVLEQWAADPTVLLPVEYYRVEWRSFADHSLTQRPRGLVMAVIDSTTLRSTSGVDYHLRQILNAQLTDDEKARVSLAYREVKARMSAEALGPVNDRIEEEHRVLHDKPISLAMDQTPRTSWEGAVVPHVGDIPFSMVGQGQQAAIKLSMAMSRHAETATFVMIEEPENHLSFTSLAALVGRIRDLAGDGQQLFITTHSSFVLNRLGLDALHLLSEGGVANFRELSKETVRYFQKLPGHDTLRMVLADRVVLVEGPSDEIVFERVFVDRFGRRPIEAGIDVLSVMGVSFRRCLELCHALGKRVAVVRDNDGTDPTEIRAELEEWLSEDRDLFVGEPERGHTLEPQIIHANGEKRMQHLLGVEGEDLGKWMSRNKTEGALRIALSEEQFESPPYISEAADFIHG